MLPYILKTQIVLPITVERAWEFFSNAANLPLITPPELGFKVLTESPGKVYPGMILTYEVRPLLSIPMHWITEITHVQEQRYFVDEQRFGPYRFWQHQHHFTVCEHGTVVEDVVHYGLYGGFLATPVHEMIVRPQLKNIFEYREQALRKLFLSAPSDVQ